MHLVFKHLCFRCVRFFLELVHTLVLNKFGCIIIFFLSVLFIRLLSSSGDYPSNLWIYQFRLYVKQYKSISIQVCCTYVTLLFSKCHFNAFFKTLQKTILSHTPLFTNKYHTFIKLIKFYKNKSRSFRNLLHVRAFKIPEKFCISCFVLIIFQQQIYHLKRF